MRTARVVATGAAPIILLAILVAGGAWIGRASIVKNRNLQREMELRSITTVPVTQDEFVVTVETTGRLEAVNSTPVMAEVSGQLVSIALNGIQVHKGDLLATLDVPRMARQLQSLQTQYDDSVSRLASQKRDLAGGVESTQYTVDQATKRLDQVKQQQEGTLLEQQKQIDFDADDLTTNAARLDRQRRLAQQNLVAGQDVDRTMASVKAKEFHVATERKDLEMVRAQGSTTQLNQEGSLNKANADLLRAQGGQRSEIRRAEMDVQVNAQQLARMREQLEKAQIKSPADGILVLEQQQQARGTPSRDLEAGDPLWQGAKLATIADISKMRVLLNLQQEDARLVKRKQKVYVYVDAVPGKVFDGEVAEISQTARQAGGRGWGMGSGERTFEAHVDLKLIKGIVLRPGMTAQAHIVVQRVPKALSVPIECIFAREEKSFVYLKQGNRFVPIQVELGPQNADRVVIKNHLKAGDLVALRDVGEQGAGVGSDTQGSGSSSAMPF